VERTIGVYFMIVRIKKTDDFTSVKENELYEAIPYWIDPVKVTLLKRIPDGYCPECNQYINDLEIIKH